MPPALSVPSLSEWSTPVCSFLISLVRVLSEPSRDVNGTYEVESVCLVFHLIRELRSEGLQISTERRTYFKLTPWRPWPHLDQTVMMWSTLDTWLFDGGRTTLLV